MEALSSLESDTLLKLLELENSRLWSPKPLCPGMTLRELKEVEEETREEGAKRRNKRAAVKPQRRDQQKEGWHLIHIIDAATPLPVRIRSRGEHVWVAASCITRDPHGAGKRREATSPPSRPSNI